MSESLNTLSATIQRLIGRGNALVGFLDTPDAIEAGAAASYLAWQKEADAALALASLSTEPMAQEGGEVGEVVAMTGSLADLSVVRWAKGNGPGVGTKLYASPVAPSEEVTDEMVFAGASVVATRSGSKLVWEEHEALARAALTAALQTRSKQP